MTVESRISLLTFCLAILLHLLVIVGMARFPPRVRQVAPASVTQTVVRLHRPALKPARLPVQSAPSSELTPVADIRRSAPEPRHTQPTPKLMPRSQPIRVAKPVVKPKPVVKGRAKPRPKSPLKPVRSSPVQSMSKPEQPVSRSLEQRAALPVEPPAPSPVPRAAPAIDKSVLLQSYLSLVAAKLERHKRYPISARRRSLSGRVVLQFTIGADGQVSEPQIVASEGHAVFRTASLRTLKRVKAMPPFPTELERQLLQVTVPMVYTLKSNR